MLHLLDIHKFKVDQLNYHFNKYTNLEIIFFYCATFEMWIQQGNERENERNTQTSMRLNVFFHRDVCIFIYFVTLNTHVLTQIPPKYIFNIIPNSDEQMKRQKQ